MLERLIERIRSEVSGERALESVRAITRFHRVQASPGLDGAADWVAEQCESYGLRVEIEHVNGDGRTRCLGHLMPQGWECSRALAVLDDGGERRTLCDYERVPLSLILRSTPARGTFEITWLEGADRPGAYAGAAVRGRIVLTDRDVHRVHELAVVEHGAAGLLSFGRRQVPPVRIDGTDPDALAYTSFWWGERERRGWGFVISPREAAALRERLGQGARPRLEVAIDSRAFDTRIPLVSALQKGAGRLPEVVIVSHLCHPQPSANDNASGDAANLEAARALAALDETAGGRRRVRHLWMPEFTGTYAWLAARAARGEAAPFAALNLDMVGEDQAQCGSTFLIEHPPWWSASFAETLIAEIRERAVDRWPLFGAGAALPAMKMAEVTYSGGSDHTVFQDPAIGTPCPMLIQWPDRFYHSSYDTPERSDPASLALAARCAAVYAAFVAGARAKDWGWLAAAAARRGRRRLLEAAGGPDAERTSVSERLRCERALASVLGCGPPAMRSRLGRERAALQRFFASEIATLIPSAGRRAPAGRRASPRGHARVPQRVIGAPLHHQRWLLPGWETLGEAAQDAWRSAESPGADLAPLHELAWGLADGRRTVGEIADAVWLESGRREDRALERFLEWTAALGLSSWNESGRTGWKARRRATGT